MCFNLQKQPMGFDDTEHSTLHWVEDLACEELEFVHDDEITSCVYESFYVDYELEFATFAFDAQCDDSLHASLLASLTSLPTPSNDHLPSAPSSSSLELKPLPSTLKYAFFGPDETFPVILANDLTLDQEKQVLDLLRENQGALGWTLGDIRGISPTIVQYRIHPEDNAKSYRDRQRRLNPTLQEVVRKEVLKWLDHDIIYPISDSEWVSPVHVVPKKTRITVIKNDKDELIPTRIQSGWRVCIDYRKLNSATRKDHFSLPFLDQMLERLAGRAYYCFLDGYSGYTQVPIAPED